VAVTGSTNADLVARARDGERGPHVLVALQQTAGRGRLGRDWQSRPGESVAVSLLWCPVVPQARWTWVPLVVGLGVVEALRGLGVDAGLKWPNDVVVPSGAAAATAPGPDGQARDEVATPVDGHGAVAGLRKLAGVLVEVAQGPSGPAVVAGVGLNLRTPPAALAPLATSLLALTGGDPGAVAVAVRLAGSVSAALMAWEAVDGDPAGGLRERYLVACTTLGREVRVTTPAGERSGTAVDVDVDGALVLRTADGREAVSAGDVRHVR